MKKKCFSLVIISIMIFVLTACEAKENKKYEISDVGSWVDGTYKESAKGHNGKFEVIVVIENGKMKSISVGDNKETPEIGSLAIKKLPAKMVENQSYKVDAISEATVTSNGLKDAVARCLEKASTK